MKFRDGAPQLEGPIFPSGVSILERALACQPLSHKRIDFLTAAAQVSTSTSFRGTIMMTEKAIF